MSPWEALSLGHRVTLTFENLVSSMLIIELCLATTLRRTYVVVVDNVSFRKVARVREALRLAEQNCDTCHGTRRTSTKSNRCSHPPEGAATGELSIDWSRAD